MIIDKGHMIPRDVQDACLLKSLHNYSSLVVIFEIILFYFNLN